MSQMRRTFMSLEEVMRQMDQLIAGQGENTRQLRVHEADQLGAAARDARRLLIKLSGMEMARSPMFQSAYLGTDDREFERRSMTVGLRMLLATYGTGMVKKLCEHVGDASFRVPVILACDPPEIVCVRCLRYVHGERTFNWPDECDACGLKSVKMAETTRTLGSLIINGNICPWCVRWTETGKK